MTDNKELFLLLKKELTEIAHRLGIKGISKLTKTELINIIQSEVDRKRNIENYTQFNVIENNETNAGSTMNEEKRNKKLKGHKEEKRDSEVNLNNKNEACGEPKNHEVQSAKPDTASIESLSSWAKAVASKYSLGIPYPQEDLRKIDSNLPELPQYYGDNKICLLPRDPNWLYTYWFLKEETVQDLLRQGGTKLALKLFDADSGNKQVAEFYCEYYAKNWYIPIPNPGNRYYVELGYITSTGKWLKALTSNVVKSPVASPSSNIDDIFITIPFDQDLKKLFPRRKPIKEIFANPPSLPKGVSLHDLVFDKGYKTLPTSPINIGKGEYPPGWSGFLSSFALPTSPKGEKREKEEERPFRFWVDAQLTVYGATEPTAKVFIAGEPIKLREDGSFSIHVHLPATTIEFPLVAIRDDGKEKREITLKFTREDLK